MAIPSSKYAEDENARQTLANGTVLKWTKQNSQIYPLPNVETDRSICYCNWKGELDYANRGFHQWQGGCVTGDDLGHNGCEGAGFENLHANSLKQNEFGQPRMEGIYTGVVLTNTNGDGTYVWGYNPEASACINSGNGADRRYLLDMDVNKMIFNVTFDVYDQAAFDAIDYINSNNPESNQLPSTHNITLKQLYENPDDYYVASFNFGTTYIYGENTSDHWRGAQVYPAHIINSENVGQFKGTRSLGIFGMHYNTGNFSYDNSNPMNPNAHPIFTGGGATPVIYNNMNNGYFMACGRDINLNPVYSYSAVGTSAETIAQFKWGTASSWNHTAYVNQEFFDYGGSVIWCAYGAHAYYNVNTSESKYREYIFSTRKMLKGQYALDYVASFGLYFASEAFDPDSVNLTPETLGDDNRIMLGEMSADGTTTGRWITDIDSYHGPNKDGKTSNPSYNPSGGGGGGTDGDDMDSMHTGFASSLNGCAKYYLMSPSDVRQLITDFYTRAFAGSTMSESIISCYLCGIEPSYFLATSDEKIKIPTIAQEAIFESLAEYAEITAVNNILPAGHITVPRLNNDFHDYSPYSIYEVFIPFCGWCSLPDTVAGRTIWVELHVDIRTMGGKGIVLVEGSDGGKATCAEMAMNFGATSPFAVIEAGLARQAAVTAGIQTAVGFASGVVGALSGHNALTVSGVGNAIQGCANGAMSSMTNYTQVQGKAGDTSDFANGRQCYLKVSWSKTDEVVNNSMFGHTIGYLCNEVGKLSDYKGFTVILNPHITGIDCTEEEKEEIKRLLENGVIL